VHHVSYSSGSCLPTGEGSGAPRILWLWILPPCREGSGAATTCPVVSCGPWISGIKKSLASLSVQLGTHVPNARGPVSKAADVRAIIGLQDMHAGCAVNACRTCGHVTIVWLQCQVAWPLTMRNVADDKIGRTPCR
jgi:hypothetical protein